jgi:CheY-like chemotaxis protein
MVLRPGWSIHTAFMRFPIDAIFLDADQVVIRIEHEVGPWRTVSCRGAREVVEMAAGESRRRGLEVGDRVAWASRSAADARLERGNGTFDDEDDEPRARILVASRDPRFLRLARFLLGGRDFEVEELTTPERLPEAILEPSLDLAVLDGADAVAEALRTANATRARRPEIPVIIAADTGGKSPSGVRVFDRWNETEELLLDVERRLAERVADGAPPGGR